MITRHMRTHNRLSNGNNNNNNNGSGGQQKNGAEKVRKTSIPSNIVLNTNSYNNSNSPSMVAVKKEYPEPPSFSVICDLINKKATETPPPDYMMQNIKMEPENN